MVRTPRVSAPAAAPPLLLVPSWGDRGFGGGVRGGDDADELAVYARLAGQLGDALLREVVGSELLLARGGAPPSASAV